MNEINGNTNSVEHSLNWKEMHGRARDFQKKNTNKKCGTIETKEKSESF